MSFWNRNKKRDKENEIKTPAPDAAAGKEDETKEPEVKKAADAADVAWLEQSLREEDMKNGSEEDEAAFDEADEASAEEERNAADLITKLREADEPEEDSTAKDGAEEAKVESIVPKGPSAADRDGTKEAENEDPAAEKKVSPIRIGRYTMMAEEILQFRKDEAVLTGELRGHVAIGYPVLVIFPAKGMQQARVTRIETAPGETASEAEDGRCSITIENPRGLRDIDKYSVMTDILPEARPKSGRPIENPYLLGLTGSFKTFVKDSRFMGSFIFALVHANFLLPIAVDEDAVRESKETGDHGIPGTRVRLHFVADPKKPDTKTLPIFTDAEAMHKWKQVFEGADKPRIMLIRFPDAVRVAQREFNGLLLNAFGKDAIFLSNDFLGHITEMDAFKKEFHIADAPAAKKPGPENAAQAAAAAEGSDVVSNVLKKQ